MGHMIFKRMQRLQGGTENVEQSPVMDVLKRLLRQTQNASVVALRNLPESVKKPIRQGVGRVATNIIEPHGYKDYDTGASKLEQTAALFSPRELPHTISSIIQDRSAIRPSGELEAVNESDLAARRPLFREYFDLPTQDVDNVFTHHGKNYRINPETKNEVAQFVLNQFRNPPPDPARPTLDTPDPGEARTNMISRFYIPGRPDPWDFAPHPKELEQFKGKPLNTELFGRMLLEAIGKPAVLETGGYSNPPPNEDVNPERITGGGYAKGTSNVTNNPGLLFYRKKLLKRPKL